MKVFAGFLLLFSVCCFSYSAEFPISNDYWVPRQAPPARYLLDVKLDPPNNRLECAGKIILENNMDKPISSLLLDGTRFSDSDTFLVKCGNQTIQGLTGNGLSYSQTLIGLSQPVQKGETITLEIQFTRSGQMEQGVWKWADWYPRLDWGYDTADDYEVKIDCPQEYTLAASGVFDASKNLYTAKGIRSFGMVLMRDLKVIRTQSGETEIQCFYETGTEPCAELIAKTAVEAIDFYRNWLGFYPHSHLIIVPGGMSNPGDGYPIATSIVGIHGQFQYESAPESRWRFITAHEIGHQYWMEHVLRAPDEFWLMIGLGIYADRSFMRAKGYGDTHEQEMISRYVRGVRQNLDTRMNRTEEETQKLKFDYNNVVIHGKGFGVISALAYTLGHETFDAVYRRCLKDYAGRPLNSFDFQRICQEESGQDLNGFFTPWMRTNQYLSYEIASQDIRKKGDDFEIEEKIKRSGSLRMSIPVTAYFEDGSSQVQYTHRLLDESVISFSSKSPLKEIKLDAQRELPLVIPPPEVNTDQLKEEIENLDWTGGGEKALAAFKKMGKHEIRDGNLLLKLGMCLYDAKHYEEAAKSFEKCAELGKTTDKKWIFIGAAWQGHVLDLLNQRDKAIACYRQALESGFDDFFQHDQYGMIVDRAWLEQRIKTPFKRK